MADELPFAALRALKGWKPRAGSSFRKSIGLAYRWITSSTDPADVLTGWSNLDIEFGGNVPELSVFVVLNLQALQPTEELCVAFEPRVLMTLLEVGLAVPTAVGPLGPGAGWFGTGWLYRELFPPGWLKRATTDRLKRDTAALAAWLSRELSPFGGDLAKAAEFSLRLAAIRAGVLVGPEPRAIEDVLQVSLWREADAAEQGAVADGGA